MFDEKRVIVKVRGLKPGILMHNGQLADPLNKWAQRYAALQNKSAAGDEIARQMRKTAFMGGLYTSEGKVVIPSYMIRPALFAGASKVHKTKGKGWANGIQVYEDAILQYDGPTDLEVLAEDERFVYTCGVKVNGGSTVMRTRPLFQDWSADIEVSYEPDVLDASILRAIFEKMGRQVGFGDWRPAKKGPFGRFAVTEVVELEDEQPFAIAA